MLLFCAEKIILSILSNKLSKRVKRRKSCEENGRYVEIRVFRAERGGS